MDPHKQMGRVLAKARVENDRINLDALIAAVEAGAIGASDLDAFVPVFGLSTDAVNSQHAYRGSLDAAKALHDALLPGWIARPQIGGKAAGVEFWHCVVEDWETGTEVAANNMPDPARAWLLAILKAYRATMEEAR